MVAAGFLSSPRGLVAAGWSKGVLWVLSKPPQFTIFACGSSVLTDFPFSAWESVFWREENSLIYQCLGSRHARMRVLTC